MTEKTEREHMYVRNFRLSREHCDKLKNLAEKTHRQQAEVLRLLIELAQWSGQSDIVLGPQNVNQT